MKTRQNITRNLGNLRLLLIVRLLKGTAQAHKPFSHLELLRLRKGHLGLGGELLRNRIGSHIERAAKEAALLEKENVARLGANIQEHDALIAALAVSIAISIG